MGLVEGPFPQVTFCGASVMNFSSSVGWGEQSSAITVNLVEDPLLHQHFTRPKMGIPLKFEYEGFKFEGLVRHWVEKNAVDGKPTFEISLTDPREILAGTQVILSSYRGEVGNFANLLNVFGYWENQLGFGGALTNESGMVWNAPFEVLKLNVEDTGGSISITTPIGSTGIMPALHTMTNEANAYGGPLRFMGHEYTVDLSALPVPPAYYRLGGIAVTILDMVSEICQDGGHDFICILDDHTIRFKTVSRVTQPDPGQIGNFINSRTDVSSNSIGLELRNDITNAILLGGDYSHLVLETNPTGDDTIWPYWGTDIDGSVIVGHGKPEETHTFHLNASPIVDIMGSLTYDCDIPEMRCALINYDSWAYYVLKRFPQKAAVINLISAIDHKSNLGALFPDTIFSRDLIDDSIEAVTLFGQMNDTEYWTQRAQKVFEFVRQYANDYFGRKFLVKIPFLIYYKTEPETTHIIKSDEPTDAGYQAEGSSPLGLSFLNENFFMSPDGRFQCFVKFSNTANADLQRVAPDSFVSQGEELYVKASVDMDMGVVYPGGSIFPYCVISLESPIFEQAPDPLGGINEIASLLDYQGIEQLQLYAAGTRFDSFPIQIHPAPYRPDAVAIPVKSNRDSYGPWFTTGGVDGKVSFERDEGLVPWNYGDYATMELAARAKLTNAATQMQYTEMGNVEVAGSPDYSLGDELVAGGPQLTGIDVNVNSGGVTTTYRMQTFTPRFGQFSKENADRLRRLGSTAMEMRRAVRNLFHRNQNINQIVASAQMGFMANTSRAVRQQSPHQCMMALMSYDSTHKFRTQVASMTAAEVVANCRGDKAKIWPAMALMTLEGLLRPFSTNYLRSSDDPLNQMPHYEVTKPTGLPVTRLELDPFGLNNDIDYTAWGDTYPGRIHRLKAGGGEPTNSRLLGLRGPLVVVGWGYTYTGKPVPNASDETTAEHLWSSNFLDEHRRHMEKWRAGPVGLYWDNWRKMWTIPTILFGTLDADYVTGGVLMSIKFDSATTTDKVKVINKLGGDSNLKANMMVCAAYYQQDNQWRIISAACPS